MAAGQRRGSAEAPLPPHGPFTSAFDNGMLELSPFSVAEATQLCEAVGLSPHVYEHPRVQRWLSREVGLLPLIVKLFASFAKGREVQEKKRGGADADGVLSTLAETVVAQFESDGVNGAEPLHPGLVPMVELTMGQVDASGDFEGAQHVLGFVAIFGTCPLALFEFGTVLQAGLAALRESGGPHSWTSRTGRWR